MSGPVVKYETSPTLIFKEPYCSACLADCEMEDGNWECPRCGTLWGGNQFDEPGELYEDWSGDDNEGEPRTHADGYRPTQHERDNPKPSIWDELGIKLGTALGGGERG